MNTEQVTPSQSKPVPTTILTGFLGSGKTTTIMHWLANKPDGERWAVLVNEFGEIGIDGAILSEEGALIKEVPGGCMCCAVGVPMSVALTALLREQPDRLIIEPTGLGHPKEVMAILLSEQYRDYVDLKATITLVDPRHLSVEKYTEHATFRDQLECADIVIGHKADACSEDDLEAFQAWANAQQPAKLHTELVSQGQVDLRWLDQATQNTAEVLAPHHHHHASQEPQFALSPTQSYLRRENKGEGYFSCGWLFGAEYTFNCDQLLSLFNDLNAERIKGVLNTDQGCMSFNVSNGIVSMNTMSLEGFESRLEVIDTELLPWHELESILLALAGISQQPAN
ncbi:MULTISPECIES: GTP-binding protein [unclassified Vibrio]|uniref:GTP-binding protein n=1 Tax=Vibrio sp. HB236076 TaxID=3232307 RepID=A0AB39HLC7_9VIBR|nr:GTP-binding protein [Vibrio sp. HB161653]MDP5253182.1 GTP-binding protein [Vibrio sp. HB161653]